jgi:hypothetical protein
MARLFDHNQVTTDLELHPVVSRAHPKETPEGAAQGPDTTHGWPMLESGNHAKEPLLDRIRKPVDLPDRFRGECDTNLRHSLYSQLTNLSTDRVPIAVDL